MGVMKKGYVILFSLAFVLMGCKQSVYLTVTEPAEVFLEKSYINVAILNRSLPAEGSRILSDIENALTLEGNLDRKGSEAAIKGLYSEVTSNPQFKQIVTLDSMLNTSGALNNFPSQLDWNTVRSLCDKTGSQLLFVLEFYDTDTKVSYSMQKTNQTTPFGNMPLMMHTAHMSTHVKMGWRIYDPINMVIRDRMIMSDVLSTKGSGITPINALAALMNRGEAVRQISNQVGEFYAERLIAKDFRVWRTYFKGGSSNLKIAKRKVEVGDWDGAAELWKKDLESSKAKTAGRAAYNLAIYYEVNQDVYLAYEWAKKAYSVYNIKEAKAYSNKLKDRIYRIEKNKRQLELEETQR